MKIKLLGFLRVITQRRKYFFYLFFISPWGWAHDVTVNLTGTIITSTCTVASDSLNKMVSMGNISKKMFFKKGDASPSIKFTLNLENCPQNMNGVQITMNGKPDPDDSTLLILNSGPDAATGIGIALQDKDHNIISINTTSSTYALDAAGGNANLVFYAQYEATGNIVNSGDADGTATFTTLYP